MKEFFARLNPMERRFVVGVAVVFFIVINWVWIWPRFSDWGKTTTRKNTARDLVIKFQQGVNLIPGLTAQIAKYQKQGQVVPEQDQAVQFSRLIVNQAARSGVIISSMGSGRQASIVNNPFFVEQNETIVVSSGEKQLVDFLYNLGAGDNSLIRVKVLSVQPDQARQGLAAHVTLIASYQKKLPTAGAAAPTSAAPAAKPAVPPAATPAPAAVTPKPPVTPKPIVVPPKSNATNPALPGLPAIHNLLTPSKK
jgi:hypothetical protein